MKRIITLSIVFFASTCFAQMYTVTDLGTLGGSSSHVHGINSSGQVVGYSNIAGDAVTHAFRTAPGRSINPAMDDLGTLGGTFSEGYGINDQGQVVGWANIQGNLAIHAFRTGPNTAINPATDDLGTLGGATSEAFGINNSGQVAGFSFITGQPVSHAFRTAPNAPINPITDDLGTLGGTYSYSYGLNESGQVFGASWMPGNLEGHAFRTAPSTPINPATDDLGTLGGTFSSGYGINNSGQVVGESITSGNRSAHAFRTAPSTPINPATDDLGTLGETYSFAYGIDSFGQVVGSIYDPDTTPRLAFLYTGGVMHDLGKLITRDSGCVLTGEYPGIDRLSINDAGQIAADGVCHGQVHAILLGPIYRSFVQPPINSDGTSAFKITRAVVPMKFTLTRFGLPTCTLAPATFAVTRTAGGTLGSVTNGIFSTSGCQYHYNLRTAQLGVGVYRVDISINGIMVGHAVFALK